MAVTTNKRRAVSLLLTVVLSAAAALLSAPDARAHAAYESSSPAFAEVLSVSPTEINIRFSQELFRHQGANRITLNHADSGNEVALTDPRIDNEDRHVMTVAVDNDLEPGRYLVAWTNLSAEDGDSDSGSYPFYIARNPVDAEIEQDRRLARELLIAYPGDEQEEREVAEAGTPSTPAVVRAQEDDDASLSAGPILWLVAGGLAALCLVGALGFHLGTRRRGAQ